MIFMFYHHRKLIRKILIQTLITLKMKRDFNCYQVHCGLSPLKPVVTDTRSEESHIVHYDEFCKDCAKEYQRLLYSNVHHGSPKNVNVKSEGKPVHNKENHQVLWRHTGDANEMDNHNEDSGYSSVLGNQFNESIEHNDTLSLAGNLLGTPNSSFIQKKNLLPVLHFEKFVCSTLKKNSKRNPKSWAVLLDKMVSRESMGFTNLIGRKMGIDKLDILGELFNKEFRHLVANILRHLSDIDLINVAKVSTTWKKILHDDKWAVQLYNKALKLISNNNCKQADTRKYALHREALTLVQKVGTAQNATSEATSRIKTTKQNNQSASSYSRHAEFSEVARTLKNTESLKVCHRCGSPSKYDSHLQRAVCTRESCGFDFCTKCFCKYHSAKDCATGKSVKPTSKLGAAPGTKKSKQNLRRL
ncbi:F-box only protein 5 isoform X2 [Tiliqua scincoides]|uniref:F-box only protein 5 isoform X2 n=1 Tax=Tiliqua scincoides TaxID=71010 RepID=UPI003461A480